MYEYVGFDGGSNRELYRRVPCWELRVRWLRGVLRRDRAACCGYKPWLYVQVHDGELVTAEMLDWNMEVVK